MKPGQITDNQFGRNVLILTAGPILSALVSFLAEPLIARFFPPEVYGPGMIFVALTTTISPLMFLRYNFALVQTEDQVESSSLMALCLLVFAALALFIVSFFGFFPQIGVRLFGFNVRDYLACFTVSVIFGALTVLLKNWFTLKKIFYLLTISTIITQVSATVLLIILGALGYRMTEHFIIARTISFALGPTFALWFFLRRDLHQVLSKVSVSSLLAAIRKYRNFPLFEFWGFLASLFMVQVPLFMISRFWGPEPTGLYAKAFAILGLISMTLSDSVNRVFHREIAGRIQAGESYGDFVIILIKSLVKLLIIPFALIFLIGDELFALFLGENWRAAGEISSILIPWFFFSIISISIRPLYNLLFKQRIYSVITFTFLFSRILVFFLCQYFRLDFYISLMIFVGFVCLSFLAEISFLMRLARLKYKPLLVFIGWKILQLIPLGLLNAIMRLAGTDHPFWLLVLNGALSSIYLYYYIYKDQYFNRLIRQSLGRN